MAKTLLWKGKERRKRKYVYMVMNWIQIKWKKMKEALISNLAPRITHTNILTYFKTYAMFSDKEDEEDECSIRKTNQISFPQAKTCLSKKICLLKNFLSILLKLNSWITSVLICRLVARHIRTGPIHGYLFQRENFLFFLRQCKTHSTNAYHRVDKWKMLLKALLFFI